MRVVLIGIIAAMCAAAASAQTPQAEKPPAAGAALQAKPEPQAAASTPPAPENYTYEPAGRRDPFLNLLTSGADSRTVSRSGDGPASMTVAEISVRGVLQSRGALVAMVMGPDKKTYVVHQGDKFLDGTIRSITPQGLIVLQEVNDPLSLVKQREVRKFLRSIEDGKE